MSEIDPKASEAGVPAVAAAPAAAPTAAPAQAAVAGPKVSEQTPATAPADEQNIEKAAPALSPIAQLWEASKASSHPEIWGVTLADPDTHVPSQIVLQKYLNANDGDVAKAKEQLIKTLEWREKMKPLDLLKKAFDKTKFGSLGYVTAYVAGDAAADPELKEVFNWNIYGAVESIDQTFGNLEQ